MSGYGDVEIKSNSKFLKIESGVPHDIRLLTPKPDEKIIHKFGQDAVECEGEGCEQCNGGDEPRQRFSAEVYDHTLKRKLTWEYGSTIATQLKAIDTAMAEEGRQITMVDLKVEARGEKMSKKYMVTPRSTAKPLPEDVIPF